MSYRKKIDLIALIGIEVFATCISFIFRTDFLTSTILFLGAPTLYLVVRLRTRTQWPRIIAMALLFGVWYGYILAYLADWNHIWAWPERSLPWGWFLGINPVEWVWVFFWTSFIVLFYEHFIERDKGRAISPNFKWAVLPAICSTIGIFIITYWCPFVITWPYAYAVLTLLTLPPAIFLFIRNPRIYLKISLPALFFIPLHLAHEITSVTLNQWYFPGQYIGFVPLPGHIAVPIEEFIVWIFVGSILVLSYYELYIDDGR